YGVYVHIFNWISVLSIIALGGRDDLLLAKIPKYLHNNETDLLSKIVKKTNFAVFIRSVIVIGVFLIIIFFIDIKTLSDFKYFFASACISIYLISFTTLNQSALQALNYIKLSQLPEKIIRPLLLVILIFSLKVVSSIITVKSLIIIANLSSVGCCIFLLYFIITGLNKHKSYNTDLSVADNLSKQTFYFFLISLFYLLSTKISMLILPYFVSEKNIGIFNIAYRFSELLIYPFFLMHYILPQLFAKHHLSGKSYKQSLFSESTLLTTLLSIPIFFINIFAGKFFLEWFGKDFVMGYDSLIYLSIAQLLFSIFGPTNTILMMQGNEKYSALSLFVYVILLLTTSLLIIPTLGVAGAAISVLISSLLYNILLAILVYKLHGVISPLLTFSFSRSAEEKN
ncbi:MAG TPA: oligosaccharide flippase family protein, partial [Puia sp.]|nr:oligosaccharide flippase family protein [Puia sp.]